MKNTIANSLIIFSFLCMVAGCLTSCNVTKRAERKLDKSVRLDRLPFTLRCASDFPYTDSVNEKTVYISGETIRDTFETVDVQVVKDTVFINRIKTVTVTNHDTVLKTVYKQIENKAKIEALQAENKELHTELTKTEQALNIWRIIGLAGIVAVVLWVVFKVFGK